MSTLGIKPKVLESANYIRQYTNSKPKLAIVLGTGMHSLADLLIDPVSIDYRDIPFFPTSTVQSHKSKLLFGKLNEIEVVLVAGRFHYYEGYSMDEVTYYIHVLKEIGVQISILTSASGGLNPHYAEGELVMITDHINLFSENPLRGQNDDTLGPRFPDLLNAYPKYLRDIATKVSSTNSIQLKEGVYLGWQGPSLETPAEYKMANLLGADLVGMSTIPEVIINKYRGIKTLAFTIVSNVCYPPSAISETTVDEVIAVVNNNAKTLQKLLLKIIPEINN